MTLLLTATETSTVSSLLGMIIPLAILFVFFYFAIIKPQKKEQKKMNAMLSALEVGDAVLTTSGFFGVVIDINDDTVIVEFGNNKNCRVPMQKSAIAQVDKGE